MNILLVGPCTKRTKGGISTVITGILESNIVIESNYNIKHIISHIDGSIPEKIIVFLKSVFFLIRCSGYHLAHIHVACNGSFYRKSIISYICSIKKIPFILHVHGPDFDSYFLKSPFYVKQLIKSVFKKSAKIILLSNYWESFFLDNIITEKIEILPNGVTSNNFKYLNVSPDNINNFLFLGKLEHRKGIYDLIEAINILVNEKKHKSFYFYLAGNGEIENVARLVKKYSIGNNVVILGWIDSKQKNKYLKLSNTLILPSYNEGLPMAILESMAKGQIIISTFAGGIPDLVIDGVNGFLLAPGDIQNLASTILYVAQNAEKIKRISYNNITKIKNEYDIETINARLLNIYRKVASYS